MKKLYTISVLLIAIAITNVNSTQGRFSWLRKIIPSNRWLYNQSPRRAQKFYFPRNTSMRLGDIRPRCNFAWNKFRENIKPIWQKSPSRVPVKLAIGSPLLAMFLQPLKEKYLKEKYRAPGDLRDAFEQAYNTDTNFKRCIDECEWMERVCKHPNIPYFVKKVIPMQRLEGLERIKKLIKKHNLTHIIVPKKFVWREWVVAQEIEPKRDKNGKVTLVGITKDQFKELMLLHKELGFWDFKGGNAKFGGTNVFFSKADPSKLVIVDTKTSSFGSPAGNHRIDSLIDMMTGTENYTRWSSKLPLQMKKEGDVDDNFVPKNIDAFWSKYSHCFKEGNDC